MTSSVAILLESLFKDAKLARKYAERFEEESIETIEDLETLDVADVVDIGGMRELHAKRLVKSAQRVFLKIAVDRAENVVGSVRVHRGAKLRDVRAEIVADRVDVPEAFVFRLDDAVVTRAQEAKWDAGLFFGDGASGVCVVSRDENAVIGKKADVQGKVDLAFFPSLGKKADVTSQEKPTSAFFPVGSKIVDDDIDESPFTESLPAPSSFLPDDASDDRNSDWFTLPMEAFDDLRVSSKEPVASTTSDSSLLQRTQVPLIQDKALPVKKLKPEPKPEPKPDFSRKTDVYIGNLAQRNGTRISDDRIRSHVYQFGLVKRVQRLADDNWAYVIFGYPLSARICIKEMHGLQMGDTKLVCTYATDRTRAEPEKDLNGCLRLTGVPRAASPKQLMNAFFRSPYVQNIVQVKSKEEAFVMFRERMNAAAVARQYPDGVLIRGQTVSVEMCDDFDDDDDDELLLSSHGGDSDDEEKGSSSSVRGQFTFAVTECIRSNVRTQEIEKSIVPLVTTDARLEALCLVLVEQCLNEPSQIAALCADLCAVRFTRSKNYRYGDFKKVLLSHFETALVHNLDVVKDIPDHKDGTKSLIGLMRFLAHLHKAEVVSAMILLGYASKTTKIRSPACRDAIRALLKHSSGLKTQPHLQTKIASLEAFSSTKDDDEVPVSRPSGLAPLTEDEKYELGEKLYNKILKLYPETAAKITGMLLDLGPELVNSLLKDRNQLYSQAERAQQMLVGKGYY